MSNISYNPGVGNAPFGNLNTNPQASNYGQISGYTPDEANLIQKAIKKALFDAAPEQYWALRILFEKPFKEVNLDEFEYLEYTFGRSVLTVGVGGSLIQPAAPGVSQTVVIPLTAASMNSVTEDLIVVFPNNAKAVITAVGPGNQITVTSQTSDGIPATLAGDVLSIQSTIQADGMDYFSHYQRLETITRYNFVQFFARACRWNKIELQKYINAGTTDYLVKDKEEKIKQMRIDLFNTLFNGQRGEFPISGGHIAKATGGIFPTMQAAGSANANPTLAGLQAAFETLAFNTNFKKEGAIRFIYATDEMLYELSRIYKHNQIRYAPENELANMNLKMYEIGNMKFVPVSTELFRERSCFPTEWSKRLLVLDQETITPVIMKGIPAMNMGSTLDRKENGTRENFKDFYVEAQLGLEFHNPLASFWIDVQ